jgi:hypothetical protein
LHTGITARLSKEEKLNERNEMRPQKRAYGADSFSRAAWVIEMPTRDRRATTVDTTACCNLGQNRLQLHR